MGIRIFRNSTDDIQRVTTRQDPTDPEKPESDVLYTTSMNAGSQYSIGSNAGASYRLFKWWNINGELNYYYRDRNIPEKEDYVKSSNEFSARMRSSFNIPKAGTRIQFGMRYSAPRASAPGIVQRNVQRRCWRIAGNAQEKTHPVGTRFGHFQYHIPPR